MTEKKKSLAILVPSLSRGGMERMAVRTAEALSDRYDIQLVVFENADNPYVCSLPIKNLNLPASNSIVVKLLRLFKRRKLLQRYEKEQSIDICLSFGDVANVVNALTRTKTKKVLSVRGFSSIPNNKLEVAAVRSIYRRSDAVLCVSKAIEQRLCEVTRLPKEKFGTLYNYCDIEIIEDESKDKAVKHDGKPTLVCVGRLEEIKGVSRLLYAFSDILTDYPDAKLCLVGDGSLRKGLEETAKELKIDKHVFFEGLQDNPYRFLTDADIYVLSSIHEGFPCAVIEAMAVGLPIVAADCETGPREILAPETDKTASDVEKAEYGILLPSNDDKAFSRALKKAVTELWEDRPLRKDYSEAAKRRVKDFSKAEYIRNLEGYFSEVSRLQ